jgi:plasmid segregation protein ParM
MKREFNTQTVGVRAVDVGYFQTKFTLGRQRGGGSGGPIITDFFPSIAPKVEPARPVVTGPMSAPVKGRLIRIGDLDYFVGPEARFYASSTAPRSIGENFSESATYKALTYGALDQMAVKSGGFELVIEHLVVGLPCNTISKYGAGLKRWLEAEPHMIGSASDGADAVRHRVVVRKAHVIAQPYGALVDYGVVRGNNVDGWALVVDPGGGTLDWFCASKQKANWARSGAYPKAMLTCAFAVADAISPDLRDSVEVIERIDRAIRRVDGVSQFKVEGVAHDISTYWERVESVLQEAVDKMMASVGKSADLDLILVTGGGAGVFSEFMKKAYPVLANRIQPLEDSVFANVRGFHAIGEQLQTAGSK